MANSSKLEASQLLATLQRFSAFSTIKTWWLAYSGGVDSRVLLHLLSQLNLPLRAVYVDHGLQAASTDWAEHCRQTCTNLNVPFTLLRVDARPQAGESPEAAARQARYQALAGLLAENDCLLTAQHADDQAETFLLQLLRGAGAAGLSAMPFAQVFHRGWLLRPLLHFSRQQIRQLAQDAQLHWVDDPSNSDLRFDRNFLRNTISPLLMQRWPQCVSTINRAAQQQAENQQLLEMLAIQDLAVKNVSSRLPVESLLLLDEPRQRNALRYWLEHNHVRMPSRAVMQQIITQLVQGRDDAEACVNWDDVAMHRYRGELQVHRHYPHDVRQQIDWDGRGGLCIASLQQKLVLQPVEQGGLRPDIQEQALQIRFRQGGEKIRPAGHAHTRTLKNLLQEAGVPPWQRDRIPLLYLRDELIAVCGYWLADNQVNKTGPGLLPVCQPLDGEALLLRHPEQQ